MDIQFYFKVEDLMFNPLFLLFPIPVFSYGFQTNMQIKFNYYSLVV